MSAPVQQGTVIRVRDLSPSVRELTLTVEPPIGFVPGQWVSLKLPVGSRPPLVRAYSMAEPPSADGTLVLVFDRVPDGLGSSYLFTLKSGDTVPLSGPHGHFVLPEPLTKRPLFIARFTGIVPVRCIIQDLVRRGAVPAMTLLYGAPSQAELIYDEEFRALASAHPAFHYLPCLDEAPGPEKVQGLVRSIVQRDNPSRDLLPMVAGTKAFVRPLRALLTEMGFERREIRHETYD